MGFRTQSRPYDLELWVDYSVDEFREKLTTDLYNHFRKRFWESLQVNAMNEEMPITIRYRDGFIHTIATILYIENLKPQYGSIPYSCIRVSVCISRLTQIAFFVPFLGGLPFFLTLLAINFVYGLAFGIGAMVWLGVHYALSMGYRKSKLLVAIKKTLQMR